MKKALILVGAIAAFSFSQASELWWTVAGTYNDGTGTMSTTVDGKSAEWTTAKLFASDNGYNYGGSPIIGSDVSAADMNDWGFWNTDIDTSTRSFYVELYNSDVSVGKSYFNMDSTPPQGATPYAQLSGAVYDGNLMNPTASAYTFSSFTTSDVIPEPSSGLMMLLGMIALGLKRKKV